MTVDTFLNVNTVTVNLKLTINTKINSTAIIVDINNLSQWCARLVGSTKITTVGIGTGKIEEELKLILPEARIQRMDLETTRAKYSIKHHQ